VGHANFVNVGKAQGDGQLAPHQVLPDLIDLPADVSAGFAHERQKLMVDLLGWYVHSVFIHDGIIEVLPGDFY
jgi:hypothetical protein